MTSRYKSEPVRGAIWQRIFPMRGDCLSPGRVNKAVVVSNDHPALLRARRRKERWSEEDVRLCRRHRWRSEGFHGEAKCWHGLARAIRRGLQNMRIQAFLTAMVVNLNAGRPARFFQNGA